MEAMYAVEAIEESNSLAAFYREVITDNGWQDTVSASIHTNGSESLAQNMVLILAAYGLVQIAPDEAVAQAASGLLDAIGAWL